MPVLNVDNVSKKYLIGHEQHNRFTTFRDVMTNSVKNAADFLRGKGSHNREIEEFWALRDISFEVEQGERLGIIGKNGAGKSTLLKLISRITPPTTGRITIDGRVSSLLEVGTGFHPELSGRENIYLNGAILGMSRREINRLFDEIVSFAEIERFLDTPVKRYSSGMYVRLAFAVAAHLEPEVLIVDEVLAVGDIQFQKKCLGKMEDVSREGRTVLFVSHNMPSLLTLTSRCILLDAGRVATDGPTAKVISEYQNSFTKETLGRIDLNTAEHYGNGKARYTSIRMRPLDDTGRELPFAVTGCDLDFVLTLKASEKISHANVAITLYDDLGGRLVDASSILKGDTLSLEEGQVATTKFTLRNVLLNGGVYTAGLWLGIANQEDIDGVRYATTFRMEHRREDLLYSGPFPGPYVCAFEHEIAVNSTEATS